MFTGDSRCRGTLSAELGVAAANNEQVNIRHIFSLLLRCRFVLRFDPVIVGARAPAAERAHAFAF